MSVQLTLQLQPGLTQRFKSLRDVAHWCALNYRGGPAAIAPSLDMSPSTLSRKLAGNPDDPHRTLDIDDFVKVIEATGDHTPIYWLIERFLPSEEQKQQALREQIATLVQQLGPLLADAGVPAKGRR